MNRLLLRSSARFYLRHPSQGLLAVAGIALGVAVFIGVTLANDSATRAFEQSAEFIRGRSTHRLLPVGRELGEQSYVDLVRTRGLRAAPVLEVGVRLDDGSGRRLTLLGVDPIEEAEFRDFTRFSPRQSGADIDRLLTRTGTALIPDSLLAGRGGSLAIATDTGTHEITAVGALSDDAIDMVVTDVSTAQELTGRIGLLSRIDLILTPAEARALEPTLPAGTALVAATNENAAFRQLARAFQINVSALGLLALVVGAFLIYSTMAFAVVQRRKSLAILRALGASEREVLQTLATEALAIGALGTTFGAILGSLLAERLVGGVAATIDDFAFSAAVAVTSPSPWLYVQGFALGLTTTLLAAVLPLLDAARIDPATAMQRSVQERATARRIRFASIAALALLATAGVILSLPTRSLGVAFAGLACVLAAGAAIAPAAIIGVARWLEPLLASAAGLPGRMAARNVRAYQSRIAVAAAALTVAVATVIGVGLMIGSFRASLTAWLDTTLTSDVFVSADRPFDPSAMVAALEGFPQVVGTSRTRFGELPTEYGEIGIRAYEPGTRGYGLHIVDGDEPAAVAGLAAGTHVAIAEPFAYRNGLRRGDTLTLPTPSGSRGFPIAGIYRDYNTGGASVLLPLEAYRADWHDDEINTLGLELDGALPRDAVESLIRDDLGHDGFRITSTAALKDVSLRIFDRTFEITNVLRTLAGLVAFLGMLSALLAIQLERRREFAILRALGFPPRGLGALVLTETGLTGIAAGLVAIPIGTVLAGLLVYVINRRSFGWSMELIVQAQPIAIGVALATAAALLAGVVPSLKSRGPIESGALHDE